MRHDGATTAAVCMLLLPALSPACVPSSVVLQAAFLVRYLNNAESTFISRVGWTCCEESKPRVALAAVVVLACEGWVTLLLGMLSEAKCHGNRL